MGVRDVIREHLAGKRSGHAVVRAIMDHSWTIPATIAQGEVEAGGRTDAQGRWYDLYTTPDRCPRELRVTANGAEFFRIVMPDLYGVNVDPNTPEAIHYRGRDQIDMLVRWARGIQLERWLAGKDAGSVEPLLRAFDGWSIAMRLGGPPQMILAPDDKGRKLAAVFTAPDCLEAFLEKYVRPKGIPHAIASNLTRKGLFAELLKNMAIDGIVFNCVGPGTTKAVAPAFVDVVLKA